MTGVPSAAAIQMPWRPAGPAVIGAVPAPVAALRAAVSDAVPHAVILYEL